MVDSAPTGLNLDRWWRNAACLGTPIADITKEHCWSCPVQHECLWVAITEDDRILDRPLFIRGGLTGGKREDLWYWSDKNIMKAYTVCVVEADRMEFATQRRAKTKRTK